MRVPETDGHDTKKTALVKEPETFWRLMLSGAISWFDHEGARMVRRTLRRSSANGVVL